MLDRHGSAPSLTAVVTWLPNASATIGRWRDALCLSNDERDAIKHRLRLLQRAAEWQTLTLAQRKRLLADAAWPDTAALLLALDPDDTTTAIQNDTPDVIAHGTGIAPARLVNGDMLVAAGWKPGPAFGKLLEAVYDEQLESRIHTRNEAMAWLEANR